MLKVHAASHCRVKGGQKLKQVKEIKVEELLPVEAGKRKTLWGTSDSVILKD